MFQSRQLSLSVAFASNTLVSLHYSLLLNNTKSGYFTSNLPFSLHSVAGALEQLSLHDGSPLGDHSPSHCACSDTNDVRHKAQHQHQHIWLVLTHNVGLFNVIFNNVVNGLNVNIWGLSL